jgi:hypothetical protein
MRWVWFRAGVFTLVGAVIFLGLTALSRPYPPQLQDWQLLRQFDATRNRPETVEAIILGNSHAREAIDLEVLGKETLVLGLPLNDLAEVQHQVRTLLPRLINLEVAFIGISYFSFHWSNDGAEHLLYARRTLHALLPVWRPVEGDLSSVVRGKAHWVARPDRWQRVLQGRLRGVTSYEQEDAAIWALVEEPRTDSMLMTMAEKRAAELKADEERMLRQNPDLPAENYARLSATIEFLQRRGVRVVLFTPPFHPHFRNLYRDRPETAEMRALAQRLTQEHGLEYLDFSDHAMGEDPRWFRDGDHVNRRGAKHFTSMLLEAAESGIAQPRSGVQAP